MAQAKTTLAREFLRNEAGCPIFVNADLIAAGLSPFAPELAAIKAGRLMLEAISDHVRKGDNFAFGTTLAGLGYARAVPKWRAQGFVVKLIFLSLPDPETAIARVAVRVVQGGHAVPQATIRRRFAAGLRKFSHPYRGLVDMWQRYDNASTPPALIAEGGNP